MDTLYDVVVVGGGPAGLTAAIYLARARYRVLVVEKDKFGGQITITASVVNYPGATNVSGSSLTETMRHQAQDFGAEFLLAEVEALSMDGPVKTVRTSRGEVKAFGVLIATGARPRMIGFAGEEAFKGRGVAYCATCDGQFFTGKDVFVLGGGFAAAEEAVFLTKYARKVTMLIREPDFTCDASVAQHAIDNPNIEIHYNTEMLEVGGEDELKYARYKDNVTGDVAEYLADPGDTFGVFVFAGYAPASELVKGIAQLNEGGYIITDINRCTDVPGLYAAGDICVKNLRQLVTATGDGAVAATELEKYAEAKRRETGLAPQRPTAAPPIEPASEGASEPDGQDGFFTEDIKKQLGGLFERMERPLALVLELDDQPLSKEVRGFAEGLAALTDKLSVELADSPGEDTPAIRIFTAEGEDTGLAFHGVPGGHEFNAFAIGLYNAAGPGQALDEESAAAIASLTKPVRLQMLISLSCTLCPDLVMAAQQIAARSPLVIADVYDLAHFPALKERYKVMSVPCLVLNGSEVSFGKKNTKQVLSLIEAL